MYYTDENNNIVACSFSDCQHNHHVIAEYRVSNGAVFRCHGCNETFSRGGEFTLHEGEPGGVPICPPDLPAEIAVQMIIALANRMLELSTRAENHGEYPEKYLIMENHSRCQKAIDYINEHLS